MIIKITAIAAILSLFTLPILAQDLGHEYEFDAAPIREGEKPVIPLDTGDPSYNIWRQLRDFSKDPKREPGPINIQKYEFGMSYNAMPTFFNQPVAMTPEDLLAGKVDVAIIGAADGQCQKLPVLCHRVIRISDHFEPCL